MLAAGAATARMPQWLAGDLHAELVRAIPRRRGTARPLCVPPALFQQVSLRKNAVLSD